MYIPFQHLTRISVGVLGLILLVFLVIELHSHPLYLVYLILFQSLVFGHLALLRYE